MTFIYKLLNCTPVTLALKMVESISALISALQHLLASKRTTH